MASYYSPEIIKMRIETIRKALDWGHISIAQAFKLVAEILSGD